MQQKLIEMRISIKLAKALIKLINMSDLSKKDEEMLKLFSDILKDRVKEFKE